MDPRRLRAGDWVTGLAGAALAGVMFMDWYDSGGDGGARTAWESLSVIDVVLALTAAAAVAVAIAAATQRTAPLTLAIGALLVPFATVATALVAYRVAFPPGGAARELGAWLGLVACAGVAGAALWAIRDESFTPAVKRATPGEIEG